MLKSRTQPPRKHPAIPTNVMENCIQQDTRQYSEREREREREAERETH